MQNSKYAANYCIAMLKVTYGTRPTNDDIPAESSGPAYILRQVNLG